MYDDAVPQALYRREPVVEELPLAIAVHRDEGTAAAVMEKAAGARGGHDHDDDDDDDRIRAKRGVMEAQLSLPEVRQSLVMLLSLSLIVAGAWMDKPQSDVMAVAPLRFSVHVSIYRGTTSVSSSATALGAE